MRYSVFLASALAASAVAMPYVDERAIKTRIKIETAIETVVVFVTVTRGAGQPTASSPPLFSTATPTLNPTTGPSSSSVSQPSIRTSGGSLSQPTGIAAPGGTSLASSSSSRAVTSSSRTGLASPIAASSSSGFVFIPPIIFSSLSPSASIAPVAASSRIVSSSSSSAASIASVAASPVGTSPSVAGPTSIQVAPTLASSTAASAVSSSASPSDTSAQIGPTHLSGPQQAFLSSGTEYQNAILYHHNAARANHNAAPLVWNTTCEDNALIAANMCNFAHYIPPGAGNGQNLFTVSGTAFNVTAGITESWYKSEFPPMLPYFGQANLPDAVFHQVGHLTQVVWQGTTSVGCVSIDCGDRMMVNGAVSTLNKFTVCNYAPPGNIVGQYDIGVLPPISTTNLGSWSD